MPKPKDVGLIFDATLENFEEEGKELLTFRIRASGYCTVNVTPDVVMEKMGSIVGGNFGFIEPGTMEKVSLIWPTVSLYNRVGLCPISVTSTNIKNEEHTLKRMIKFDTRFEALDPDNRTLRQKKEFFDCQNWDKDYFKNCTPVDCEERYFGLRNFYNETSGKCEEVPRCSEKYELYNPFTNECTDTRVILSDEDLKGFREGNFDNNEWEIKSKLKHEENKRNAFTPGQTRPGFFKHSPFISTFQQANDDKILEEKKKKEKSVWVVGMGKGLLIVFVTIAIYLLICFGIFLLVNCLSRSKDKSGHATIVTPRQWEISEENIPLYTSFSLMSHR